MGRRPCLEGRSQGLCDRWLGSRRQQLFVTFKCSDIAYDVLKEQPGLRPAPYLASRGMTWIQRRTSQSMDDAALKDYLRESHRLVALKLTKQARKELGLAAS